VRFRSTVLLASLLTILVPCAQLVTAQAAAASTNPAKTLLKPNIFPAKTAKQGGRASGPGVKPSTAAKKEVVTARSRNSRTYVNGTNYETLIYAGSVNYQDAKGQWQPIDDTLIPISSSGYAYKNKANSYTSAFPASLASAPIRFTGPAGTVAFSLLGAQGTISTTRNEATYKGALPGVTVSYATTFKTAGRHPWRCWLSFFAGRSAAPAALSGEGSGP